MRDFPDIPFPGITHGRLRDSVLGRLTRTRSKKSPKTEDRVIYADFCRFYRIFLGVTSLLVLIFKKVGGAAVRAFGLPRFLDRQIHLRMRIPQVHTGHRTGQRQVLAPYAIPVLCIGWDQVLIDRSCSCAHSRSPRVPGSGADYTPPPDRQPCAGSPYRRPASRSHQPARAAGQTSEPDKQLGRQACHRPATNARSSLKARTSTSGGKSFSASRCRQRRKRR